MLQVWLDEAGLTYLHVFPFSPREGTPAARMPQLPRQTVKSRAAALRAKGESARAAFFAALVGSEQDVLVEENGTGRTQVFAPVNFSGTATPGSFVRARITGAAATYLSGEILS